MRSIKLLHTLAVWFILPFVDFFLQELRVEQTCYTILAGKNSDLLVFHT